MERKPYRHVVVLGVLVCLFSVPVAAAIVDNFSTLGRWARNSEGSTYAAWDFLSKTTPVMPDDYYNPYFTLGEDEEVVDYLCATINPAPADRKWKSTLDGAAGVWALSGNIYAYIPNSPNTGVNTSKKVLTQLVWKPEVGYEGVTPGIDMQDNFCKTADDVDADISLVSTYALSNGWSYSAYLIEWPYNPTSETIHISSEIYVDSLIIDTYCIPEPATLGIISAGAVMLYLLRGKMK
jgi:hypothetical protein